MNCLIIIFSEVSFHQDKTWSQDKSLWYDSRKAFIYQGNFYHNWNKVSLPEDQISLSKNKRFSKLMKIS